MLTRTLMASETAALYDLIMAVYSHNDFMSQTFAERYPDIGVFEREMVGALVLVAEENQFLLGYLMISAHLPARLRHTAELTMGVAPAAQGRGVGRRLLENAFAILRERGEIEILYLHVRADNTAAVRLYESVGFERLCVLDRDTKIGDNYFDAILMRKLFVCG